MDTRSGARAASVRRVVAALAVALLFVTAGATAAQALPAEINVTVNAVGRDLAGNFTWDVTASTDDIQGPGKVCLTSSGGCWFYLYAQFEDGSAVQLQNVAVPWGSGFPFTKQFTGVTDAQRVIAVQSRVQGTGGVLYSPWVSVTDPFPEPEVSLVLNSLARTATGDLSWNVTATTDDVQGSGQLCPTSSSGCWLLLYAQTEDGTSTQIQNTAVTWGTTFPFETNFTGTKDISRVIALRVLVQSGSRLLSSDWVPVSDPQTSPGASVSVASIGRDGSGNLTWDVTATTDDVQGAGQICPTSSGCWLYIYAQYENGVTLQLQHTAVTWGTTFPFAKQFVGSLNTGRIVAVQAMVGGASGQFNSNWVAVSDPKTVPPGSGTVSATVNSVGRNSSGTLTYDITATVNGATATDGPCGNVSHACSVTVQEMTVTGDIISLKSASIPLLASSSTTLTGTSPRPEIVAIRAYTRSAYAPKSFYSSWVAVSDPYPTREVSVVGATATRDSSGGLAWELSVSVAGASQLDGPCGGSSYSCSMRVQARNEAGDIFNLKAVDLPADLSYTGTITGTTTKIKEIADVRFYTSSPNAPRFFSSWVTVSDPYPPRTVTVTDASTKRDIPTGKLAYNVSVNVTGASLADGPCGGDSYHCWIYLQTLTTDGDIRTFRTEDLLAVGTFTSSYTGLTTQKKVVAIRAYTSGVYAPNKFYSDWLYFDDPAKSEAVGGGNAAKKGCTCSNADPINSETGEFYETETDLGIAGVGPAVAVSRTYSSFGTNVSGAFGFGWTSDFDASLVIDKAGDPGEPMPRLVHVVQENGATVPFTRADDGTYPASPWVLATLTYDDSEDTWTFTRKNKEILVFDSNGRLISRSDPQGNTVEYHYTSGRVTSIEGSGGRELTLTWTSGRVTEVTDSASREVNYSYDSSSNLTAVEDATGAVWDYTYDSSHRLLTQSSPEGGTTTNVYNTSNQVTSQTDPVGRVTTFAYSDLSTQVTLPDGSVTVYTWDEGRPSSITTASGTPLAATTTLAYDDEGNHVATADPLGKVTTSTFDAAGNELTTTDPLNRTTTRTFDSDGNVLTVEDPIGRTTTMTYNAGDLVSLTSPGGHEQTWTRNDDGTVASHTDARGKETTFTYDSAGRDLCATDTDDRESCVEYDARGFVTVSTAAGGAEAGYTYDDLGRTLTVTDPVGAVTTTTFDDNGNPLTVEDADGKVSTFAYDDANQLTSGSNPLGKVTTFTYSPRGEVATVTNPNGDVVTTTYDAQNRVATVTDGESRTTTYGYDLAGRLLTTTLPSTAVTSTSYDDAGQVATTTDALGKITSYAYDDASQLISVTDPQNRTTESSYTDDGLVDTVTYPDTSTEAHEYNANGQETSFTNADAADSTYTYDDAGLLVSKTEPGGLETSYTYNAAGLLDEVTTPNGHTSSRDYDDAGNVLGIDYVGATDDVAFTYDDLGRRLTMDDATGTTIYAYTDAGQMASVQNGNGAVLTYEYDNAGQLTTVTYPGNHNVAYTYDSAGQMTSISGWATGITDYTYTPDGYLHTREDPNGVTETRSYDANGQLTSIVDQTTSIAIADYGYTYDAAGQLITTTMTDLLHTGTTQNWGYDPLGQLTTTSAPSGVYAATPAGLLTNTSGGDELTYNSAGQLDNLTNINTGVDFDFTYDGNGNRSHQVEDYAAGPNHIVDYDYNEADNLTGWDDSTDDIDYTVDGDGLRQTRTDNTVATSFLWDTNAALPLLLNDDVYTYIYGPGLTPIAQTSGTNTEYLYADNIGTVRTITDDTATSIAATDYDAYGARATHTGTLDTLIGFTGAWTDPTTTLVYLRARDYDPRTAQFVQVDPALDTTRDPYGYTGNNPLNATDPSGLCEANASQATRVCQAAQYLGYYYSGIPAVYASVPGYLWEHSAVMQAGPCLQSYDAWTCGNMLLNPVYGLIDSTNRLIDDIKMGCDPVVSGLSVVSSASATVAAGIGGAGLLAKLGTAGATETMHAPTFVVDSKKNVTIVPEGAKGPLPTENGVGANFVGGSGGFGLADTAQNVRVLPPGATSGGHFYQNGMSQWSKTLPNGTQQVVNPWTGKPPPSTNDPYYHVEG